jgi:hypothetical protein
MPNEGQVVEAALDEMVTKVVMQSAAWWRGEQRQVMSETYQAFCAARESNCHNKFATWCSEAQRGTLPSDLAIAIPTWHTEERRALEQSLNRWVQQETKELNEAFASWKGRIQCLTYSGEMKDTTTKQL